MLLDLIGSSFILGAETSKVKEQPVDSHLTAAAAEARATKTLPKGAG